MICQMLGLCTSEESNYIQALELVPSKPIVQLEKQQAFLQLPLKEYPKEYAKVCEQTILRKSQYRKVL